MRAGRQGFLAGLMAMLLAAGSAPAADSRFDELAKQGEQAMSAGRYAEALKAFEKIEKEGPTYENILDIKFNLAWVYYLTGAYDKAIPLFDFLASERSPSEDIKQQALFLEAENYARLAGTLPEAKPERKKQLAKSIELHTKFMADYPKNAYVPNSYYGRGYAYYLDGQYEKAETDLNTVIHKFANNPAVIDAKYLLASVYSQQGLLKTKEGKRDEGRPFLDKARKIFGELAATEGNLSLANNSLMALAETWYNAGYYLDAIRYYRELRPKAEVLKNLKVREEELQTRLSVETAKQLDSKQTKSERDKLRAQIASVSETPDPVIAGALRIADTFYQLKRLNETRIVCRHLLEDNFTQGEPKQQAYFFIVNSYLVETNAEAAAREWEGFQETFGLGMPMGAGVNLAIGQMFMLKDQVAAALPFFAKSIEEYPKGSQIEPSYNMKFTAEFALAQFAAAQQTASAYLEKFPKGAYAANALYYKALSQASLKAWDDALKTITEVIERFPEPSENFTAVDEACYQKGLFLVQMKKPEDAVKHLEAFRTKFKDSKLMPAALYQLGIALNDAGKFDQARVVLQSVARDFPKDDLAPTALFQIGVMYFEKKDFGGMAAALDLLLQAFPQNPYLTETYYYLAWIAREDGRYDDAAEYAWQCVESAPAHPQAPAALLLVAQALYDKADKMGQPAVLPEDRKIEYRAALLDSAQTYEELIVNYPDSEQLAEAVPGLGRSIHTLVRYKQITDEAAAAWFAGARSRHKDDSATSAQLLFGYGNYLMRNKDKTRALAVFKEAFALNPAARISPTMLAEYAEALKDAQALKDAEDIYNKIMADNPDDPRAQAAAAFGLADIKYRQIDTAPDEAARKQLSQEARALFEKVLQDYPWYEPGKQGRVKLAAILERSKNYAEAQKMFTAVFNQEKGEAKIAAMVGVARCQMAQIEQYQQEGRSAGLPELVKVADQNLTKIIVLYEAYPEYVSEALWLKGQAYEMIGDKAQAAATYDRLVKEFKNFEWSKKAAERLKNLPPPPPPAPAAPAATGK